MALQTLHPFSIGRIELLDQLNYIAFKLILNACYEGFAFLDPLDLGIGELLLYFAVVHEGNQRVPLIPRLAERIRLSAL